jgi:hypothetical protein
MNLLTVNKSNHLIMVDYYSDYWEFDELTDTTSDTIIECCKKQFSRHSVATLLFLIMASPPGMDFQKCAAECDLKHVITVSQPKKWKSRIRAEKL